jgi:hypothetical protein
LVRARVVDHVFDAAGNRRTRCGTAVIRFAMASFGIDDSGHVRAAFSMNKLKFFNYGE